MSRPLRIEYRDAWYHVMNRGRRAERVFLHDNDYQLFLTVLKESATLWNVNICAYCLMPNHYHLLIQTPDANLSRCMRHINGVYTQRFNRRHQVDGQLFRGRYKSILIGEENYLVDLLRYICFNPVKAGIVTKPEQYQWSCYNDYLSAKPPNDWLNRELILRRIRGKKKRAQQDNDLLRVDASEDMYTFFARKNHLSILGSKEFVNQIRNSYFRQLVQPEIPDVKHLAQKATDITEQVCIYFKIEEDDLYKQKRGVDHTPRDLALFLIRTRTGKTLMEIGKIFRIDNYSSVSSAIERIKKRLVSDNNLKNAVRDINLNL